MEFVRNYPVPLPIFEIQKKLVDNIEIFLKKINKIKNNIQEVIDSFENRRSTILYKAFSGELTKKWREEKGYTLDNWKTGKISDFYKINSKVVAEDTTLASFVTMENIDPGMKGTFSFTVHPWEKIKKGHTRFEDGDVAFAKISPCFENGKSILVKGLKNGIGAGTTELIILRQLKILQKFTFYIISNNDFIRKGVSSYSGTVGQQRVSMDFVKNYPVSIPPIEEQQEIVRILDDLLAKEQKIKDAAEAVLAQIELLKKSILARAFRGELC